MTVTDSETADLCVVGDHAVGKAVADRDRSVWLVTDDHQPDEPAGVTVQAVTELTAGTLESARIDEETVILVAGQSDRQTLLLSGLVRSRFGLNRVIACVTDPERTPAFENADIETLSVPAAIGARLADQW